MSENSSATWYNNEESHSERFGYNPELLIFMALNLILHLGIIAKSDGINILFDVPASESWKAGEPIGSSATAESNSDITEMVAINAIEMVEVQAPTISKETTQAAVKNELSYVLNSKTKKFHKSSCSSLPTTDRVNSIKSRDEIIASGYVACKKCNP